jgi:2-iminoacetate synthase
MTKSWQEEISTASFIDAKKIATILDTTKQMDDKRFEDILAKLKEYKSERRLSLEEVGYLLNCNDNEKIEQIFKLASQMKTEVYGNRVVLFAPLYLGNKCTNSCTYCGFNVLNTKMQRMTLSMDQLATEVKALQSRGHKRLILVYGTHPDYDAQFIADSVRKVYSVTSGNSGEIRRVNINASPLSIDEFKIVKDAGIGTYQVFQETYHEPTYAKVHPNGEKSNYKWRLFSMDRAQKAGIDDVGLGVLFGLYDWRFEVLALLSHTYYLEDTFAVGPHTLSFPRLKAASGTSVNQEYDISDENFKKIIAILRLSVPYTGLILTARETAELRRECMNLGVSQIDAGTQIELNTYSKKNNAKEQNLDTEQFQIGDTRSLDETMLDLMTSGFVPSFCTACYRVGRTGEHFMEFSKPGFIHEFCTPNGILTLQEYLRDYAGEDTKKAGEALINHELDNLQSSMHSKESILKDLERVNNNENDIYY